MKRSGLLVAGGILAILRGAFGTFSGVGMTGDYAALDAVVPGISAVLAFELIASIALVVLGIWALSLTPDPSKAGQITGWGWVIIAAGVVDMVWATAILGGAASPAAIGSLLAFGLIGGLFAGCAGQMSPAAPSASA
ncbi:hypothetical protein [Salinibacterium sp. ZJ70]|uniref:hypothetical protein n=1 Tax=Salinibacterium sp. ZJ70 TaxID=2708084 RepID=UPI001422AA3D|nr:hypothetical protein [Salinibacterium sp. ZJ70]